MATSNAEYTYFGRHLQPKVVSGRLLLPRALIWFFVTAATQFPLKRLRLFLKAPPKVASSSDRHPLLIHYHISSSLAAIRYGNEIQ